MAGYLDEVAQRLVAADTVSHKSNAAAMGYLADELQGHGFHVGLQPGGSESVPKANLVAWAGPEEPGGLVLSGHLDVVPFEDQPGWRRDPLALERDGDQLYGRGTSDMKVFLAQCLDAARRLDTQGLQRPLVFLFTYDEEVGCLGAAHLVADLPGLLAPLPPPRLAWIGEPTSYRVFHAHKGIVEFAVRVEGAGGHSSLPSQGVNAIAVAARAIQAIGTVQAELVSHEPVLEGPEHAAALFPESAETSFNFGTIRGGTASNMIAEECSFKVSYRPLPDVDPLDAYRKVAERLADLDPRDYSPSGPPARIEVSQPLVVPGLLSKRGTRLEAALFQVLGAEESGGTPFCTDGGRFAEGGMDSLVCGPGDLEQAHQPDESISAHAFDAGTDIILEVVSRVCSA